MKKLFTLVCAAIFSVGLMAADETIFSASPLQTLTSDVTIAKNTTAVITAEQADFTGGTLTAINNHKNDNKFISKQSSIYAFGVTQSTTTIKINLEKALEAGDVVSAKVLATEAGEKGARGIYVTASSTAPSDEAACKLYVIADSKSYVEAKDTIKEGDELCGKNEIYIWRVTSNSTYFYDFLITRPEKKTIVSTTETLKAVAINNVAISETNFNKLVAQGEIILEDSYVTAPVVKFTKHVVVKYDDDTTKESDEDIEKTSTVASAGTWGASASIGGETYAVYTVKALSYTVTYKFGNEKLGEEVVAQNGHPAEYETYQTLPLATFGGWFNNADLAEAHAVADIAAEVISADKTYFAKFTYKYAKSVNVEQLVLDNGVKYNIKAAFDAANIEYANLNDLDSLNDQKTKRNEPFLGLKLKKKDAKIACRLKAGDTITVKLGNIGDDIKLGVNGQYETLPKEKAEFVGRRAATDEYLELITTSDKTVVIKQVMINEEIAKVELPAQVKFVVDCKEAKNGKISASWEGKKDGDIAALPETLITLTVTPAEGYEIEDVKVDGVSLNENEGKYTFSMPAKNVEVTATFAAKATALDNTEASVKATKRIVNGMLLIEKNGEVYNVLGTRVR